MNGVCISPTGSTKPRRPHPPELKRTKSQGIRKIQKVHSNASLEDPPYAYTGAGYKGFICVVVLSQWYLSHYLPGEPPPPPHLSLWWCGVDKVLSWCARCTLCCPTYPCVTLSSQLHAMCAFVRHKGSLTITSFCTKYSTTRLWPGRVNNITDCVFYKDRSKF